MNGIDRFNWNLARGFFGTSCVFSILGIAGNSLILLTTIKTKSMRSTYNVLIAVCAVADIFHQLGNLAQVPLLFDIYVVMDSYLCSGIMFLPAMGIATGVACIFCIGLDRMLSVMFSIRYRSVNTICYGLGLAFIIIGYCSYLIFLMIAFHQRRQVVCEIVTPFLGPGYNFFTSGNIVVNVASVVVYFILWLGLRTRASDSNVMRRIIKSLFIIVTVDVSGWFLTPGLILIMQFMNLESQQMFAWTYFTTIFIHFALSVKLFIYYSTSSEYRAAINAMLFKTSHPFRNSISTVPTDP